MALPQLRAEIPGQKKQGSSDARIGRRLKDALEVSKNKQNSEAAGSSKIRAACKVLWIAPNLNSYKRRFLNRLVASKDLLLTVLAGRRASDLGHCYDNTAVAYEIREVDVAKRWFAVHPVVYLRLLRLIWRNQFDVLVLPIEKKHLSLILFIIIVRFYFGFRLVSYNHPHVGVSRLSPGRVDRWLTRFLFLSYNRIIFYTEASCQWAISQHLINADKATFANNTLDTATIWQDWSFSVNNSSTKRILFIGRLVPSKRVDLAIRYFTALLKRIGELDLVVIGDGPDRQIIQTAAATNERIFWHGASIDERTVAREMESIQLVLVPGASGLSIVHAFCYGKPYLTLRDRTDHGPELSYLRDNVNGLLLSGNVNDDVLRIEELLFDECRYETMCCNCISTAKSISVENWCRQIRQGLMART